mgnify:CR=1 FL=1
MKGARAFFLGLIFILFCGADYSYSQTIAINDLPCFMGKIKVIDGWGDTLDFSHFVDWRIDSEVVSADWMKIKSPDDSGCWAICAGKLAAPPSMPRGSP